ncbi:hypothetical protein [Brotaphodocola sp.]|uniref:hypothetical protein n=1 Tax=Brotaphodocola sp. TaxID=3073577 RepID=UPI003D7EB14B
MNPNKKIRRLQSLLYTSGAGIILFSLWSGIRGIESFYRTLRETPEVLREILNDRTQSIVLGIVIFFMFFGVIGIYVYIGRKAILTSLGQKTGRKYLILASVTFVSSMALYLSEFFTSSPSEWLHIDDLILTLIDLTSDVILAEVVVFSILLKKLR